MNSISTTNMNYTIEFIANHYKKPKLLKRVANLMISFGRYSKLLNTLIVDNSRYTIFREKTFTASKSLTNLR